MNSDIAPPLSVPASTAAIGDSVEHGHYSYLLPYLDEAKDTFLKIANGYTTAGLNGQDPCWREVMNKDGVVGSSLQLPGYDYLIMRGVGRMEASLDVMHGLMEDYEEKPKYDVLLDRIIPVPIKGCSPLGAGEIQTGRRDMLIKNTLNNYKPIWPVSGRYTYGLSGIHFNHEAREIVVAAVDTQDIHNDDFPTESQVIIPNSGYVQMKILHFGLIIKALSEDACEYTYISCVHPKGTIPSAVVNFVCTKQPETVTSLQSYVNSLSPEKKEELRQFGYNSRKYATSRSTQPVLTYPIRHSLAAIQSCYQQLIRTYSGAAESSEAGDDSNGVQNNALTIAIADGRPLCCKRVALPSKTEQQVVPSNAWFSF